MYKALQLDHHAAMAISFSISHKVASNAAALKAPSIIRMAFNCNVDSLSKHFTGELRK